MAMPSNRGRNSNRQRNSGMTRTRSNRRPQRQQQQGGQRGSNNLGYPPSAPQAQAPKVRPSGPTEPAFGVLKIVGRERGELVDPTILYPTTGVYVGPNLIRQYRLVQGATIKGQAQRAGERMELVEIETISDLPPDDFNKRGKFKELVPVDPHERINLSRDGNISMRIIDLVAPIGKGTRALVVSPPKAGKTMLLEAFAHAMLADCPDMRVIALLVDERPEEVTHFRRSVKAEVFARTNDQHPQEQVDLVNLVLDMVRVELECGRDVGLLVDSLTRVGRAFNVIGSGTGRTMSGGVEAGALEIPRRLFGLARNIEGGGSVTIIATALVDTGSQMDQLIFQEFKGTGNCEIVLDRKLAEQRIFPAINIMESGTRKEERLYDGPSIDRIALLRRGLADRSPKDALEMLLNLLKKHASNEALFKSIPSL
jgi:transcription termination factor Rho